MNTFRGGEEAETLEEAQLQNETAEVRNVGITFETRPDICETEHIDRILELGGTRTEMGVQTIYLMRLMN